MNHKSELFVVELFYGYPEIVRLRGIYECFTTLADEVKLLSGETNFERFLKVFLAIPYDTILFRDFFDLVFLLVLSCYGPQNEACKAG